MKLNFLIFMTLFTISLHGQSSLKFSLDIPSRDAHPWRLYSITGCKDGGFAIGGIAQDVTINGNSRSVVVKMDSTGAVEWSKKYVIGEDFDRSILLPTLDSGFYFLNHFYDYMFAQFTIPTLMKLDQAGNIQHSINGGGTWGLSADLMTIEIEKYTGNLYCAGTHYEYDSYNDEPCCYEQFAVKYNDDLTVNRKDLNLYSNLFIYDSLYTPYLVKQQNGFDNQSFSVAIYDTSGIFVHKQFYSFDSTEFKQPMITGIVQDDQAYYMLSHVKTLTGDFRVALHKVDKNWNTIFFKVLDSTNELPNPRRYYELKTAFNSSHNLLISCLVSIGTTDKSHTPLMIESDTSGAIIFTGLGTDTTYFEYNIDETNGAFYFLSQNIFSPYQYLPIVSKQYPGNTTCDIQPVTIIPYTAYIVDSSDIQSNLVSSPSTWPILVNSSPILPVTISPVSSNLCNILLLPEDNTKCILKIYPNPASDWVTFNACLEKNIVNIKISDFKGRELIYIKHNSSEKMIVFDSSHLANAIYLVTGNFEDGSTFANKLVVSR